MPQPPSPEYHIAMVAYLDVLGWSQHTLESQANPELLAKMIAALESANSQLVYVGGASPSVSSGNTVISVFSDSIILSQSVISGTPWGPENFWYSLDMIGKKLLLEGFFLRGGISIGFMYHTGSIALGTALVNAVALEKMAVFPRVILHANEDGHRVVLERNDRATFASENSLPPIRDIMRCADGFEALDVLRFSGNDLGPVDDERGLQTQVKFLDDVRPKIIENMQKFDSVDSIRQKYEWFAGYYNEVAAEFDVDAIAL